MSLDRDVATRGRRTVFCADCGTAISDSARFCKRCGVVQPLDDPPAPPPVVAAPRPRPPSHDLGSAPPAAAAWRDSSVSDDIGDLPPRVDLPRAPSAPPRRPRPAPAVAQPSPAPWQASLPAPLSGAPSELLLVCALMAAAGALTLYPAIKILPSILDALGADGLARTFGLLALSVWAMLAFFGCALLYLAWRLVHGDRVARGLAYVLLGGLGVAILLGDYKPTELVLVMLACFGAIAVLAGAPRVREFFAGLEAPGGQPTAVVIARTLVAVWSGLIIFAGVTYLPLSGISGKFVAIGLLMIGIGLVAWYFNSRLATGDPAARTVISLGAALNFVLMLVLGNSEPGVIVPLSLAAGVVANLWLPAESQAFFGAGAQPAREPEPPAQ